MTVGLLIIAHDQLGQVLLDTVLGTLGILPLPAKALSVSRDVDPDELVQRARELTRRLDTGDGVLVLTDMYGSTPGNIACRLLDEHVQVIAGVNLPMVFRVLNYPDLDLGALAEKAVSGGTAGVLRCEQPQVH
ncbi:MAG: PTS fructose transporter subunit IIA [Gammaproteobacteria bacterium]|nr:PTS fructose transporter subunit IIA [Gammaproteobacteria bacterium]